MSNAKVVPSNWKKVLDADAIAKTVTRLSYEIIENKVSQRANLAIVGIKTGGAHLAKRIHDKIEEIDGKPAAFGVLDITLYRDDLSHTQSNPILKSTDLPFKIEGSRIVLVDDVLYTGRTIRAALDAITDFGRPDCVELAVLADRGHRELPIRPDYVGKNLPTKKEDFIRIRLKEESYDDGIYVISENDATLE